MKDYYTVVSSFPHLAYFADAERLPLSRLRLEQRLRMLDADESRQIFQAEFLAGWRTPVGKLGGSGSLGAHLKKLLEDISQPVLRDYVEYRLDMMTLVAALRLRQAGRQSKDSPNWGIGRWLKHIETNWDVADFRLGKVHPWVFEAQSCLAAADAVSLDRLLMDVVWRKLSRLSDENPFGFEAITAFVFKWDILQAWLLRDAVKAKQRFQILIDEVKHGQ